MEVRYRIAGKNTFLDKTGGVLKTRYVLTLEPTGFDEQGDLILPVAHDFFDQVKIYDIITLSLTKG